jgi:regulator of sirC expression with transglutaminase-like and TPR domain
MTLPAARGREGAPARRIRIPTYHPAMTSDIEAARAANRARFARLVARPEPEIGLGEAALVVAADGRPGLDPAPTLSAIDGLAERVHAYSDETDPVEVRRDRLHDVLYREVGFRAPTSAEYHDADNSRIDRVVERRVGLPISLAVVELEVAGRLGVPLWGIGLPGHFILGAPGGVLLDPAGGGRRLTPDDCQALIRRALGEPVLLHSGMLRPASRREILARMLRNLRTVHLARRDWAAALGAVDLLAIVEPTDPDHVRDRGLLLGRVGRFSEALAQLERYLAERPDGADGGDVRRVMGIFAGRRN